MADSSPNQKDYSDLHAACKEGKLDEVRKIVFDTRFCLQDMRDDSHGALYHACVNGHLELAMWLVDVFDMDTEDICCDTYVNITRSAERGHLSVFQWLLTFDIPMDVRQWSLMFINTCRAGHLSCVQELVKHQQFSKETALTAFLRACECGNLSVAQFLVETFELDRTAVTHDNMYAFRTACKNGYQDLVYYLVDVFDISSGESRAMNSFALRYACEHDHYDVANFLITHYGLIESDMLEMRKHSRQSWTFPIVRLIMSHCPDKNTADAFKEVTFPSAKKAKT